MERVVSSTYLGALPAPRAASATPPTVVNDHQMADDACTICASHLILCVCVFSHVVEGTFAVHNVMSDCLSAAHGTLVYGGDPSSHSPFIFLIAPFGLVAAVR